MKKLFTLSSVIMYLLTILVFALTGMTIAGITGAGKGQGLAAGAIVLSYAFYTSMAAFIIALIFCYHSEPVKIKKANRVLAVALIILLAGVALRIFFMKDVNNNSSGTFDREAKIVTAVYSINNSIGTDDPEYSMGLGFFKPDLLGNNALYFYGGLNLDKPVFEQTPEDSLVFKKTETSNHDLVYAPPWLLPEHYKLDYDIFYFKLISVGRDFVEVSVNDKTQKISYLDRFAGEILYWPEFLLRVHSIELLSGSEQKIHIKPLDYAGEVNIKYDFLKPVIIQDEWMSVELYDENYVRLGNGWIQWKKNNKLLISYSLLS